MIIKKQKTSTLATKPNYNSADCITPNYIYGCQGGCSSYCYMKRYNPDKLYITENIDDVERSVANWVAPKPWPKEPNQQDPIYYIADIACNTDLILQQKFVDLERILKFYDDHPKLNSTMATKYSHMLALDVTSFNKPPRIRISLMPQEFSEILEPGTTSIDQRISDIKRLQDLGWEVHLNFSPVVAGPNWEHLYSWLFWNVHESGANLSTVKSEVIFLTNHEFAMERASDVQRALMENSNEVKNSSGVMRYPLEIKAAMIDTFKRLHQNHLGIPIRYIF